MTRWLILGFGERILPLVATSACVYACIAGEHHEACRPVGEIDRQFADICRPRGAVVATRNGRGVEGADIRIGDP